MQNIDATVKALIVKDMELFKNEFGRFTESLTNEVLLSFVKNYISTYVLSNMGRKSNYFNKDGVKRPKSESYELSKNTLVDIKKNLQEIVADGVSIALEEWSGIPIDYYCILRQYPEIKNTSVN